MLIQILFCSVPSLSGRQILNRQRLMEKRKIGNSDLIIPPIVFGGNVFGWTLNESGSFDILDRYYDRGFTAIDTSNNYSHWVEGNVGGESETILGKWIKQKNNRGELVIMTKVGGHFRREDPPRTEGKYILEEVDKSLTRLQTDYIDLYQTHYDDKVTPVEETLRAYEELIKAGKVRYIGVSNISPERLTESMETSAQQGLPSYVSLQPEYNLYDRQKFEQEYRPLAEQYGLGVIPYYSLASGFLSGKYLKDDDFNKSARSTGVKQQYWNDRGKKIVTALVALAEQLNTTPSALALAWLLRQPTITAPIVSATKPTHLRAFSDAVRLPFTDEQLKLLYDASAY